MLAGLAAAVIGLASGLVLLRTTGLTLLMLTICTMALLGEAANMAHDYTGGFDGLPSLPIAPVFGVFEFNPLYADTQYLYALAVLFICFVVRAHLGLFAVRPEPHRHPRECAAHACGRDAGAAPARDLLHHLGGDRRHRRRPLGADQRLRQPERARSRSRRDRAHRPHPRRLWPALRRVHRRRCLHGAGAFPGADLSERMAARPRAAAGRDRAVRAQRHPRPRRTLTQRYAVWRAAS